MRITTVVILFILFTNFLYGQNQWVKKSDMPLNSGRHHPVTWAFEDTAYVLTGTSNSNTTTRDFYMYTASDDSWKELTDFPGPARSFAYGHAHQGKGYVGFGLSQFTYLNDLWEYDPKTQSWTELSSCPCSGRRHPAFVVHKGKIYVGLGDDNFVGNLNDWWVYDIASDSWGRLPQFPGPIRHHPYHFAVGDSIYAGFGHGFSIYKDWYRYNPDDSTWRETTNVKPFPGQARVAGTEFAHIDKGYVLSGDGENHGTMNKGEFWEFDPASGEWTELTPHPDKSRWAPGSFVLGDILYFINGQDEFGNLRSDVWTYQLTEKENEDSLNVSIAEINNGLMDIYPNPANDFLHISQKFNSSYGQEFLVYDMQGKLVANYNMPDNNALNISQLPNGAYLVLTKTQKGHTIRKRFIKQ